MAKNTTKQLCFMSQILLLRLNVKIKTKVIRRTYDFCFFWKK
jgi:hypothetical protein